MIILKGEEKLYDKIQYPLTMKTLNKLGIVGNFHNLIIDIYFKKPQLLSYLMVKDNAFSLKSETRMSALTTFI